MRQFIITTLHKMRRGHLIFIIHLQLIQIINPTMKYQWHAKIDTNNNNQSITFIKMTLYF